MRARNKRSKPTPFAAVISASWAGLAMPMWVMCAASCIMCPACSPMLGCARSLSHFFIQVISSLCVASMRLAICRISGRLVRPPTSAVICVAWPWCGIMSCRKRTSEAEKLESAMRLAVAASITRLAWPGAPGWTIGAFWAAATLAAQTPPSSARRAISPIRRTEIRMPVPSIENPDGRGVAWRRTKGSCAMFATRPRYVTGDF